MKAGLIVGIDEVGRGPVAGPVCVGLVLVKRGEDEKFLEGIKDSKKLSERQREEWFKKIKVLKKEGRLDFTYSMVGPSMIDKKGINPSIQKAIDTAITKVMGTTIYRSTQRNNFREVNFRKTEILLDGGLRAPEEFTNQKTIIKGDEKVPVISAASVVAKVLRDRRMVGLARKYPQYGFERHKGYGTKEHYKAIKKHGSCLLHRKSFSTSFIY